MRRFEKKHNIQRLNEELNKKKNSLTENSWADELENNEFPEEFKGMYDDDIPPYDPETLDGDPLGPTSDDLDSPVELQHRMEMEDALRSKEDSRFTPAMGEPHPEDEPYDSDRDERSFTPNSRFGEDVGEHMEDPMSKDYDGGNVGTINMNSEEIHFIMDCPSYMNPRQKYELLRKRFPGTQATYEDIEKISFPNGLSENKGKTLNVLSEQASRAFKNLCGLDIQKKK